MKIRKATEKDKKEISEIEYQSGYKWNQNKKITDKLAEKLFKEKYCEIFILEDKKPLGYFAISFGKKKKVCYTNYLAIKKKFQGKGNSKLMLKRILSIAKKKKCKAIELAVWSKNYPAIGLYNKFNFYVCSVKKNYYPNKDDKLRMRLELK
jgi:ribosomal protein S18 acetylase RimI-like enzyme